MKITIAIVLLVIVVSLLVWHNKRPKTDGGLPPEVLARVKRSQEAEEKVRANNPALFSAISKILFDNHPIGINFMTNTDEYDSEAGTIIPRLPSCKTEDDVLLVVYQEFGKWFGADTVGPKDKYIPVSKQIWKVWQDANNRQGNISNEKK